MFVENDSKEMIEECVKRMNFFFDTKGKYCEKAVRIFKQTGAPPLYSSMDLAISTLREAGLGDMYRNTLALENELGIGKIFLVEKGSNGDLQLLFTPNESDEWREFYQRFRRGEPIEVYHLCRKNPRQSYFEWVEIKCYKDLHIFSALKRDILGSVTYYPCSLTKEDLSLPKEIACDVHSDTKEYYPKKYERLLYDDFEKEIVCWLEKEHPEFLTHENLRDSSDIKPRSYKMQMRACRTYFNMIKKGIKLDDSMKHRLKCCRYDIYLEILKKYEENGREVNYDLC